MNPSYAGHPERSGGGKAGGAQSKPALSLPNGDLGGSISCGAGSDRRAPSTPFPPTFAPGNSAQDDTRRGRFIRSALYGWLLALFLVLLCGPGHAADVSVKASLSRTVTVIGEPVQLQIKVTGGKRAGDIPDVTVDGLEIRYAGTQTQRSIQLGFGANRNESSVIYTYEVTADKNGTYTIPAISLDVDGQAYRTQPAVLTVQPSSADDATRPQARGLVEIIVPKKTAYVGEMLPVEIRLYVDSRVKWQPVAMPELSGEGFTKQKMPEPHQPEGVTKNGIEYDLMIFKTAITPGKAGKISIGPAEIIYNAQVPRARPSRQPNPFDLFGNDIFGDSLFAQTQQIKARGAAVELTVKPLPATGQPRDFSGAVGKFQFSAEGSPGAVKAGDPVTMKMRVTGRGNFDRMAAPALRDPAGWRTYPPSGVFKKDDGDEVGLSGTKTFEMAVIPEEKKTQMPVFTFSYFDPEAEKYVTLTSDPAPLRVDGVKTPAATPAPPPVPVPPAPEAAPTPSTPVATDILGPLDEAGPLQSFTPLYERRSFWLAQLAPASVLLLLLAFRLRSRPDAHAARRAALRREKSALLAKLRAGPMTHPEFFDTAARVAQIATALATGTDAAGVDATAARALAGTDTATAEVLEEIFDARAELLFAGGGRDESRVSGDDRARVLAVLERFGRHHAKG